MPECLRGFLLFEQLSSTKRDTWLAVTLPNKRPELSLTTYKQLVFFLCLRCIHAPAFCWVFGTGREEGVTGEGGVCTVNTCGCLSWKGTKKKAARSNNNDGKIRHCRAHRLPEVKLHLLAFDARRLPQRRFENHMTARSSSSGSTSGHGNKQKSCLMCIKLKRTDLRCLARVWGLLSLGGTALLRAKQRSQAQVLFFGRCVRSYCLASFLRLVWLQTQSTVRYLVQTTATETSAMCSEQHEQGRAVPLTVNRALVYRSAVSKLQYQHTTTGRA